MDERRIAMAEEAAGVKKQPVVRPSFLPFSTSPSAVLKLRLKPTPLVRICLSGRVQDQLEDHLGGRSRTGHATRDGRRRRLVEEEAAVISLPSINPFHSRMFLSLAHV